MALPIVAWAAIYEEAARSLFGPLAINCTAPDDGNMNLLARIGTPAQKEWWLRPIVEGKVRSSFAMTEPAPGGGSDPGMIRTYAEKKGGKWMIHGRKWFITGAGGSRAFHRRRAHVRRQAPRAHRLSLSPRSARLAHRAPHRDHGPGRAWRPLRA